jgi:hypothetical protein
MEEVEDRSQENAGATAGPSRAEKGKAKEGEASGTSLAALLG